MTKSTDKPVALIMGAGDAIGSAISECFAEDGHTVCMARRNGEKLTALVEELAARGLNAHGFSCDARDEDQVVKLFELIEETVGEIDVVVFNVGANVPMSLLDTSSRKFRKIWEMACFAGFLTGREAARVMAPRNRGTVIFTGATASIRGGSIFAAFASAKHGLRALAQSMAREFGPQGIHVAHVVIDAAVETQWIRENHPSYKALAAADGVVQPKDLAENYLMLAKQPKNAWTFELDIRPAVENW